MNSESSESLESLRKKIIGIDREIDRVNSIINDHKKHRYKFLEERRALFERYETMREKAQYALWQANGWTPCVECRRLRPIKRMGYLYLMHFSGSRGYDTSVTRIEEILYLCQHCREKILKPRDHAGYSRREPLRRRRGKFYQYEEGVWRLFDSPEAIVKETIPLYSVVRVLSDDDPRRHGGSKNVPPEVEFIPAGPEEPGEIEEDDD